MPQYFADIKPTEFFLVDAEAHHACAVARHREGDIIRVFDGTGKQFKGCIDKIQKKFVRGTLLEVCPVQRVALDVTLAFVPNSRTGLEEVLDKGTQLGVSAFLPLMSQRSEYDVLKKYDGKNERWQQIMLSACKQCNTPFLPQILPPQCFVDAVQDIQTPALLAYEAERAHTLDWGMKQLHSPQKIRVYIGPAGGWTEEEGALANTHGILSVSLGVNILRAETACIAAAAKLL